MGDEEGAAMNVYSSRCHLTDVKSSFGGHSGTLDASLSYNVAKWSHERDHMGAGGYGEKVNRLFCPQLTLF